jgi:hypothetical protein
MYLNIAVFQKKLQKSNLNLIFVTFFGILQYLSTYICLIDYIISINIHNLKIHLL